MKEVQVRVWCDACQAYSGEHTVAGTALTVALNGSAARSLDLCETHEKELVQPLRALLDEYGAKQDKAALAPSRSETVTCLCPVCNKTIQGRSNAVRHVAMLHGKSNVEASRLVPPTGPSIKCPLCGMLLGRQGNGFVAHMRHEHAEQPWPLESGRKPPADWPHAASAAAARKAPARKAPASRARAGAKAK